MASFIELSTENGKFVGNIDEIKRFYVNAESGKVCIVGWGNGYIEIEVNESYEFVIEKINNRLSSVVRLHWK